MLAFLAITTVVNIALGYALAIYLGQARSAPAATLHEAASAPMIVAAPAAPPAVALAAAKIEEKPLAAPVPAPAAAETHDEVASVATEAATELADELQPAAGETAEEPVEQELLAGIEEFRNQLAQMKGGATAAPAGASGAPAATPDRVAVGAKS